MDCTGITQIERAGHSLDLLLKKICPPIEPPAALRLLRLFEDQKLLNENYHHSKINYHLDYSEPVTAHYVPNSKLKVIH